MTKDGPRPQLSGDEDRGIPPGRKDFDEGPPDGEKAPRFRP